MLAFGLVLLGVCVFAWGLCYKLSLYYPPHSVAHRMPAAKLLSGRDRSATAMTAERRIVAPRAPLFAFTLSLTFLLQMAGRQWQPSRWIPNGKRARIRPGLIPAAAHFTRPPPSIR